MSTTEMYKFPIGTKVRVKNMYWKASVDGHWIVDKYLQKNIELRRPDDYHGWDKKKKLRAKPHHIEIVETISSAKNKFDHNDTPLSVAPQYSKGGINNFPPLTSKLAYTSGTVVLVKDPKRNVPKGALFVVTREFTFTVDVVQLFGDSVKFFDVSKSHLTVLSKEDLTIVYQPK